MMKWRVRKDSHSTSIENEDIRRSLDVLDSVLAEFDDCLENWDNHVNSKFDKQTDVTDYNSNAVKLNNNNLSGDQLGFLKYSTDDTTSHILSNNVPEQARVSSPPPVPKRSPATKLTERHGGNVFTFPETDSSLDSFDLSSEHVPQQRITQEPLSSDNDLPDKCTNCGHTVTEMEQQQGVPDGKETASPFYQSKQMFEDRIAKASSKVTRSSSLKRSFKTKKIEIYSNLSSDESGFENESLKNSKELPLKSSAVNSVFDGHHAAKCSCKDRILQLEVKFAEVRRLIKLNKIRGLDSKPPKFVPQLPSIVSNNHSPQQVNLTSSLKNDSPKSFKKSDSNTSPLNDSLLGSLRSASSTNSLAASFSDSKLAHSPLMCNKCLSSLSVHSSQNFEDLPKLLPTDALNRPYLGFSYSLEDDLPPGVKEIQQTSTPKSDVSSPRLFKTKDSNLSTFSHSASSLGYVSSQSDLDINDLLTLPDKVPLSSFKSRTLPNGLDRSPFYSAEDDSFDKSYYSVVEVGGDCNDNNVQQDTRQSKLIPATQDRRRSIISEPEKTKFKHFRVFSRKSKKKN